MNMFVPRNLAVGAVSMVIGIGGNIGYGGLLPIPILTDVFPEGLPAIATAAVAGILMNLIFLVFEPEGRRFSRRAARPAVRTRRARGAA
ncbi:MAG: hypothetical protein WEA61_08460 [Anaerolineales bacterium]